MRTGRGLANSVSASKFVRFFVSHAALLSLSTRPAAPSPVHHPLANISLPLLEAAHVAREEGSLWPRVSARFQSERRDEHARPNKASRTSSERAQEQDGACTRAPRITWAPAARLRSMTNTRIVLLAPAAERNARLCRLSSLLDPSAPSSDVYFYHRRPRTWTRGLG